MIRINLAPEFIPESNPATLYLGLVVFAVVVGAAYYAPIYYSEKVAAESADIRAKTEEKKAQLSKLKLDVERINSLRAKLADVKNRAERIRVLGADRKQPILFLDKMQAVHLDKMWLKNLTIKTVEKAEKEENGVKKPAEKFTEVSLKGTTFDHSIVAEYAKRIKNEFQNAGIESANGYKDYIPPFLVQANEEEIEIENEVLADAKKIKSNITKNIITPVLLKEIVLKKSTAEESRPNATKIPVTEFELVVNTNMQMD